MPVSGRPTKASLLKITQGSSAPAVKGLHKVAREPAERDALGAAIAGSDDLRFHSRLPKTTSDVVSPARSRMTAIRQTVGTVVTVTTDAGASRAATPRGPGNDSADLASNVR